LFRSAAPFGRHDVFDWCRSPSSNSGRACHDSVFRFNRPSRVELVARALNLWPSFLAWIVVWVFWLVTTRDYHPTWSLALIVTTSLMLAYAVAAYINHLILLPRLRSGRSKLGYMLSLAAVMVILTATALAVIRMSYSALWGPDPDSNGAYKHFGIDLFGMAVHLVVAAIVVWGVNKWRPTKM
jgi:membrane-bound metal-dependent hydrolase YbcI (DUF457 family)